MVYANDREQIRRFRTMSDRVNPDFMYAGEDCYDWELSEYQLNYYRTQDPRHVPLARYQRPGALMMTALHGFDDRSMVNQCLLYRYVMSHEPFNFKGRLEDYPLTLEYAAKMEALRTELREWFWDGEFRDVLGAQVTVDGAPHHPYTVFVGRGGRPGVAIANYDRSETITVRVSLAEGSSLGRYRLVDDAEWKPASGGIVLPPLSAAVVVD